MKRIEVNKKHKGYEYLVYAVPQGHRCGYVKIPSKHFLYRKKYSATLKKVSIEKDMKNTQIGKRGIIDIFCAGLSDHPSISLFFDVHGGITWSDWGKNNSFSKPGWWLGFDCAHSGDAKDYDLMDERQRKIYEDYPLGFNDGIVRSKVYTEQECKNLIDQIIKYFDKEQK